MIEIRNGGFELGNVDFWTVESGGSLVIDSGNEKYGTYSGKFTSSGDASELIINNDYIAVRPHDLIGLVGWVKSNTTRDVAMAIFMYDSDYSYIGGLLGSGYEMDNTYIEVSNQLILPEDVAYIRVGYHIASSAVDEVFYLDGYNASIVDGRYGIVGHVLLVDLITIGSTGNTLTKPKSMLHCKDFTADLNVDSGAGTNPTLDVTIYDNGYEDEAFLVGTFAQKTGMGSERISLTNCIGNELVAVYVIGGTNPLFTFQVHVTGKR